MPSGPDRAPVPGSAVLSRVEREVTVLLRRSMEDVWAAGYGSDPAVDRFTYSVLALLDEHGPQDLTTLTARLGLTKATASRRVSRLSGAGLVATEPEGRAMRVALTPAGDAQVAHVRGGRTARLGEVLAGWSPEDGDALAALLHRLNTDLDSHRRLPS